MIMNPEQMARKGQVKMKNLMGKVRVEKRILALNSRIVIQNVLAIGSLVSCMTELFLFLQNPNDLCIALAKSLPLVLILFLDFFFFF